MIWTRLRKHRSAHQIAAIDDLRFPAGARQRLTNRHPHLGDDDIQLVEAATRQWFRLIARHRRWKLSMPSVAAGDLWQELALHTRDYAAFCDAAFAGVPRRRPGAPISPAAPDTDRTYLRPTLEHARLDEGCHTPALPLLFRLDESLRIQHGNYYLADCGGRGECFEAAGLICLQHLAGPGKRQTPRGIRGNSPSGHDGQYADGLSVAAREGADIGGYLGWHGN
jgi:hypothetical protein